VSIGKNKRSTEVPATAPAYLAFEGRNEKDSGVLKGGCLTTSESVKEGVIVAGVLPPPEISESGERIQHFDSATINTTARVAKTHIEHNILAMNNETRMSDKAKGKQRAYPISRETKLGQEMANYTRTKPEPAKIQLAIRFVDGAPDMMLEMSPEETGTNVISAVSRIAYLIHKN